MPAIAKYVEYWKNYYEIIQVSPSAEPKTITTAYERLAHLYNHSLSDQTKESKFFSEMMSDINEAYQILSDPIKRVAYDRVFMEKYYFFGTEIEDSTKDEIIDMMAHIA